jgi:hypothetical protein
MSPTNADRLLDLTQAVSDRAASACDLAELEAVLLRDPAARRLYLESCQLRAALRFELRASQAAGKAYRQIDVQSLASNATDPDTASASEKFPAFAILERTAYTPVGHLASGWPVAYLIATVLFAIGLTVAAFLHVSQPTSFVLPSSARGGHHEVVRAGGEGLSSSIVARITAMVDCEWEGTTGSLQDSGTANQKSQITNHKSLIHLGDRLALRSGLLEITYGTGAKVILQGPVTYEIESPSGGYLSVGKLTAKLEQKSEVRGQRSEPANQKSETRNQKSFAVRTPTALVTDLGTEFGVEVDKKGQTKSHVFRGSVRLQVASPDGTVHGNGRTLRENESARVERGGEHGNDTPGITIGPPIKSTAFVREIPKRTVQMLDLVDVVAGGNGFSGHRNAGIDPATGRATTTPPKAPSKAEDVITGDGKYHRVEGLPFVDGVFIPDGRRGPVQVDSAGHTYAEFLNTTNITSYYIWAGGRYPIAEPVGVHADLGGVDYAAAGHAVLFLESNKGITFDLDAIRRANPGYRLQRFHAMTGNTEVASARGSAASADVRVLVDGRMRFQRCEINRRSGVCRVAIPLRNADRFLTLAATDGGDIICYDWIIFGDPRLELVPTELDDKEKAPLDEENGGGSTSSR